MTILPLITQVPPPALLTVFMRKLRRSKSFPTSAISTAFEEDGEIRNLLYGHYRITYLRRKKKDIVDILGVFHGALDIDKYIEMT